MVIPQRTSSNALVRVDSVSLTCHALPAPAGTAKVFTSSHGSHVIGSHSALHNSAFLMIELITAMAIFVIAFFPLAYSVTTEAHLFRATYQRAVAMEIVDGEMEILAAGEWREFPEGTRTYPVHAKAAVNLPPGKFQLTRAGSHLRLEWDPAEKTGIGKIIREVTVK